MILAFPPVDWHKIVLHAEHRTTVWAWENTVVIWKTKDVRKVYKSVVGGVGDSCALVGGSPHFTLVFRCGTVPRKMYHCVYMRIHGLKIKSVNQLIQIL